MALILELVNRIRKLFALPKAFSWSTLIFLSIFSWIMSAMSDSWVRTLLSTFGWMFLIFGTAWGTNKYPVKIIDNITLGPWITGALVSIFLFDTWGEEDPKSAFISWPTISTLIAALPEFVSEGKFRIPPSSKRQDLVLLLGSNLLISCWLQFHFLVQDWLRQYPSLLADNFSQSTMVVRLERRTSIPANGVLILDAMEPVVKNELAYQPWPQVERWLLEAQNRVAALSKQVVQQNLSKVEESALWRVEPRVSQAQRGYNLQMLAIWSGPSSNPNGYYLSKYCEINQTQVERDTPNKSTTSAPVIVGEIACEPVVTPTEESPPAAQ